MSRLRVYRAILVDTWREARSRWIVRVLGLLVLLILVLFLTNVDLDVSKGSVDRCGCFPGETSVAPTPEAQAALLNATLRRWFTWLIFPGTLIVGIILSAQWVPGTFRRRAIDRYLTRPIGRAEFLIAKQASTLSLIVAGNVALGVGIFLAAAAKTGIWHWPFLLAATVFPTLTFLVVYGYMTLVGILTESTPASGVAGFVVLTTGMWIEYVVRAFGDEQTIGRWLAEAAAWCLPRTAWLFSIGKGLAGRQTVPAMHTPILATLGLTVAVYGLAVLAMRNRDY